MQFLASDIGFGSTKNKTENKLFKFPSAVAIKKNSQADISTSDLYHYEGIDYIVGELATRDALTTRDYSFLEKYAPLLLFKSINDAGLDPTKEIHLATGLSLLNWTKKEEFANKITDFVINKIRVNNINVKVIPQGKGIYVDCLKSHPELSNQLVLIVDIGYNTLDVIPFENGKALAHEAWATSQGVNLVVDELRKIINRDFGISANESRINDIMLKGSIVIDGEDRDLNTIIDSEKRKYKELILNELIAHNTDLYKSANKIIIAGGGGYILQNLEFKKNVMFANNPLEFSNVQGYWSILKGEV